MREDLNFEDIVSHGKLFTSQGLRKLICCDYRKLNIQYVTGTCKPRLVCADQCIRLGFKCLVGYRSNV